MTEHISDTTPNALPPGSPYSAWRLPQLTSQEFLALGSPGKVSNAQLKYLASYGLLAPTTHNTVPQRFRLDALKGRIDVLADRKFILPESDARGRQCLVSLGGVVCNICTAAKALGGSTRVEHHYIDPAACRFLQKEDDNCSRYLLACSIFVRFDQTVGNTELLGTMARHKVLRSEYDREENISSDLESKLFACVDDIVDSSGDVKLHLIKGALTLKAMGRFQEQADRFVFENQRFANELGNWLLPNQDDSTFVGMRGKEFGFGDEFSEHVHFALLGQRPLLPDQVAGFAKGGRLGLESSTGVAVLSIERDEPLQQLQAGCVGQSLALMLASHGFSVAYHAALTEVGWAGTMFAASVLRTRRRPTLIFRFGKAKRPEDYNRPQASRPLLENLLID